MEEDIKFIKYYINEYVAVDDIGIEDDFKFQDAIENLIKAYKQKDKDNNDLRRLYRKTAEKLRENGKEEMADYFLAQINEVPTFVVDSDIDYYTEYYKFINGEIFSIKQLEYIEENQKKYFINKKAVKEKIEELKQEYKIALEENSIKAFILKCQIQILQELLEEELNG